MARFTPAYSQFVHRLAEVRQLRSLAENEQRAALSSVNGNRSSALCRAGIVMLSSHIEGYVQDIGILAIDRIVACQMKKERLSEGFLFYCSQDLIEQIRNTSEPKKVAVRIRELISRDADIWGTSETFSQPIEATRVVRGFANPKTEKIKKFFRRFGYDVFVHDMQSRLKADYNICSNMVDNVVDQRNKIAHGSIVSTSTPSDLSDMERLVKKFCQSIDVVVADWFRQHGCVLR